MSLQQEEKTPVVVRVVDRVLDGGTPAPRRAPPPGRPPGAMSLAELKDRITADVARMTRSELEQAHAGLRAEVLAETRRAMTLALASLALNVVAVLAIVLVARATLGWVADVGVAGLGLVLLATVWSVARRARVESMDPVDAT